MGPKAPTLAPKIRASSTECCQICPLSIYGQNPRLCDKDGAGLRLGITWTQKVHLTPNDDLQDTPPDCRGLWRNWSTAAKWHKNKGLTPLQTVNLCNHQLQGLILSSHYQRLESPTDTGHRLHHHRGVPGKSGIPQIMPLDDDTPVYSFNHAHTTLLLGCTDFTQGFRHSNLDSNPSPGWWWWCNVHDPWWT